MWWLRGVCNEKNVMKLHEVWWKRNDVVAGCGARDRVVAAFLRIWWKCWKYNVVKRYDENAASAAGTRCGNSGEKKNGRVTIITKDGHEVKYDKSVRKEATWRNKRCDYHNENICQAHVASRKHLLFKRRFWEAAETPLRPQLSRPPPPPPPPIPLKMHTHTYTLQTHTYTLPAHTRSPARPRSAKGSPTPRSIVAAGERSAEFIVPLFYTHNGQSSVTLRAYIHVGAHRSASGSDADEGGRGCSSVGVGRPVPGPRASLASALLLLVCDCLMVCVSILSVLFPFYLSPRFSILLLHSLLF